MVARWPVSLLALALLCPALAGLGAQARGQDTRPGIAVFPFDNGGSYGQNKDNFDALPEGIAGLMISDLAANTAARVVEREELRSEEHTAELQSLAYILCRLLLAKKNHKRL